MIPITVGSMRMKSLRFKKVYVSQSSMGLNALSARKSGVVSHYSLNFGPQHPIAHVVLRLILDLR